MAPGKKQRAKAVSQKQLNNRIINTSTAADEAELIEGGASVDAIATTLVLPWKCLAYASILDVWGDRSLTLIQNYSVVSPVWVDQFTPDLQFNDNCRQLLWPPLQQYIKNSHREQQQGRNSGEGSISDIMKLWQERQFEERLQMAVQLAADSSCMSDAAWGICDLLPNTKDGWMERVKVAAAACEWATQQVASKCGRLPQLLSVQHGLEPLHAAWLRALFLLAKTVHAAQSLFITKCWDSRIERDIVRLILQLLPDDPLGMRFLVQRVVVQAHCWHDLLSLCDTPIGIGKQKVPDTYSLATAYNRALAAFHEYGGDKPIAISAAATALELDRCCWVPLMLAGEVLATPVSGPVVALGSKEEATAYCSYYGMVWWEGTDIVAKSDPTGFFQTPIDPSPALCWLLSRAGLAALAHSLDRSRLCAIMFNTHNRECALQGALTDVVKELQRRSGDTGSPAARTVPPEMRPVLLRCQLVLLCCMASCTANLPPVDAGEELWVIFKHVSGSLDMTTEDIKTRLVQCATVIHDITSKLLLSSQAAVGLAPGACWAGELAHAARTLDELQPARVRWLWQAGEIHQAKDVAAELLKQQQLLHKCSPFSSSSSSSSSKGGSSSRLPSTPEGTVLSPGPVLFSLAAVQDMLNFLNKQALAAARSSSGKGGSGTARLNTDGGSSSRSAAAAAGKGKKALIRYAPIEAIKNAKECCDVLFNAVGGRAAVEHALLQGRQQQQQRHMWLPHLCALAAEKQEKSKQDSRSRPSKTHPQQQLSPAAEDCADVSHLHRNKRQQTSGGSGVGNNSSGSTSEGGQLTHTAAVSTGCSSSNFGAMLAKVADTPAGVHGAYLMLQLTSCVQSIARRIHGLAVKDAAAAAAAWTVTSSSADCTHSSEHGSNRLLQLLHELVWLHSYVESQAAVMLGTLCSTAPPTGEAAAAAAAHMDKVQVEEHAKSDATAASIAAVQAAMERCQQLNAAAAAAADAGSRSVSSSSSKWAEAFPGSAATRIRAMLTGMPALCSLADVKSSSSGDVVTDAVDSLDEAVAICMPLVGSIEDLEIWVTRLQQQQCEGDFSFMMLQLKALQEVLLMLRIHWVKYIQHTTSTILQPPQQQQQRQQQLKVSPRVDQLSDRLNRLWCVTVPAVAASACSCFIHVTTQPHAATGHAAAEQTTASVWCGLVQLAAGSCSAEEVLEQLEVLASKERIVVHMYTIAQHKRGGKSAELMLVAYQYMQRVNGQLDDGLCKLMELLDLVDHELQVQHDLRALTWLQVALAAAVQMMPSVTEAFDGAAYCIAASLTEAGMADYAAAALEHAGLEAERDELCVRAAAAAGAAAAASGLNTSAAAAAAAAAVATMARLDLSAAAPVGSAADSVVDAFQGLGISGVSFNMGRDATPDNLSEHSRSMTRCKANSSNSARALSQHKADRHMPKHGAGGTSAVAEDAPAAASLVQAAGAAAVAVSTTAPPVSDGTSSQSNTLASAGMTAVPAAAESTPALVAGAAAATADAAAAATSGSATPGPSRSWVEAVPGFVPGAVGSAAAAAADCCPECGRQRGAVSEVLAANQSSTDNGSSSSSSSIWRATNTANSNSSTAAAGGGTQTKSRSSSPFKFAAAVTGISSKQAGTCCTAATATARAAEDRGASSSSSSVERTQASPFENTAAAAGAPAAATSTVTRQTAILSAETGANESSSSSSSGQASSGKKQAGSPFRFAAAVTGTSTKQAGTAAATGRAAEGSNSSGIGSKQGSPFKFTAAVKGGAAAAATAAATMTVARQTAILSAEAGVNDNSSSSCGDASKDKKLASSPFKFAAAVARPPAAAAAPQAQGTAAEQATTQSTDSTATQEGTAAGAATAAVAALPPVAATKAIGTAAVAIDTAAGSDDRSSSSSSQDGSQQRRPATELTVIAAAKPAAVVNSMTAAAGDGMAGKQPAAAPSSIPLEAAPAAATLPAAAFDEAEGGMLTAMPVGVPALAAASETCAAAAAAAVPGGVPAARGKKCAGCGLLFPKLFRCSGCAAAGVKTGYCSAECQIKAWPAHKKECKGRIKKKQQQQQHGSSQA